jgi:hypothetical protein
MRIPRPRPTGKHGIKRPLLWEGKDVPRWTRDAERLFASRMGTTTVEVPASHVAMVSHPDEAAQLIRTAMEGARRADD